MKKLIALLLACLLLTPALAEGSIEQQLEAEVTGTRLLGEWEGRTSDEVDWLVVDLMLTNWHVDAQSIADKITGKLVFRGAYTFEGTPAFDDDSIGPLVERRGAVVFEIPKLVSRSLNGEDIDVTIAVEGQRMAVQLENVGSTMSPTVGTLEGPGYDTPEDAVLAYLDGMDRGDASAMLSTFAMESYAEHVRPEYMLVRLRSSNITVTGGLPLYSDYARSLMPGKRYSDIAGNLFQQYYMLSTHTDGKPIMFKDASEFNALLEQFRNSSLNLWKDNVEFVEWIDPVSVSDKYASEANMANIALQCACSGAEDYALLAAHVRLNGVDAVQTMGCARYDGRWYNLDLSNNLSNLMGMDYYTAGLLYPDGTENWSLSDLLNAAPLDSDVAAVSYSWEKGNLSGSAWRLASLNQPGIDVADSAEGIREQAGSAVWATLRFMRFGGAVAELRFSPSLDEALAPMGYDFMAMGMPWSEQGGVLQLGQPHGIPGKMDMEGVRCERNGDSLTLSWPMGLSATFRRVEGPKS